MEIGLHLQSPICHLGLGGLIAAHEKSVQDGNIKQSLEGFENTLRLGVLEIP